MYLLPPDRIDGWWPLVAPLVSKAWDKTNVGSFLDLGDLYVPLREARQHAFISEDATYAGVFRIKEAAKGKSLYFWLSGGQEPSGGWDEVDRFLLELAPIFNCKFIQLEGRLGWKRKVEPLGYQVDSLIFTKEVSNEFL